MTLADSAKVVRWAGPAFVLFSVVMVPWTIYLGYSLPAWEESPHYDIAWAGFDVLLLVLLAGTGYFALRRSAYLAVAAAATATLLVVDAWFDIMTSPRRQLPQAITLAVLVELPLAAVCAWLSYHTQHLEQQRIVLRRPQRRERGLSLDLEVRAQTGELEDPADSRGGASDDGPPASRKIPARAGDQPCGGTVDKADLAHVKDQMLRPFVQDSR